MLYVYENPNTGEVKEVSQKMSEVHRYFEDGVEWNRVFLSPQLSTDTRISDTSEQAFVRKSGQMQGTMGDLYDLSKEFSHKREKEVGKDTVKEKFYKNYSDKRGGKPHSDLLKIDKVEI